MKILLLKKKQSQFGGTQKGHICDFGHVDNTRHSTENYWLKMEVIQVPICLLYLKTVSDWSSCHAIETKEEQTINSSRKSCGREAKHFVGSISWTQLNGHLGHRHGSAGSGGYRGEREGQSLKDRSSGVHSQSYPGLAQTLLRSSRLNDKIWGLLNPLCLFIFVLFVRSWCLWFFFFLLQW